MLSDKLASVAFVFACFIAATSGEGTVGEESKCFHSLFTSCHSKCSNELPSDKKPELQACLKSTKDDPFLGIHACLTKNGLPDDHPCFTRPGHGGLKHFAGAGALKGFEIIRPYWHCVKKCIKDKQPPCDDKCAPADDKTKEALKTCVVDAMKSSNGTFPCMFRAVTGQNPRTISS